MVAVLEATALVEAAEMVGRALRQHASLVEAAGQAAAVEAAAVEAVALVGWEQR